jgi:hypothetical protein
MPTPEQTALWRRLSDELLAEVAAWRTHHPRATLDAIEQAVDARLVQLRARLLQDVALDSPAADWRTAPAAAQPACPQCGALLRPRGKHRRQLQTQGGQPLTLDRIYGVCPACGAGLFPPG